MKNETGHVKILVLSRPAIAQSVPDVPYIVVSVTDPGADEAELAQSALCRGVLRLMFDDAEYKGQTPRGKTLISTDDADAILAFVRKHVQEAQEPVTTILCQCEMGRSRSAGMAAALSQILHGDDTFFFANYSPNRWVYQTILDRHKSLSQ